MRHSGGVEYSRPGVKLGAFVLSMCHDIKHNLIHV